MADGRDDQHLSKLLEDSEKRDEQLSRDLDSVETGNGELPALFDKEKEEMLKTKIALKVAAEKDDKNRRALSEMAGKVSELEDKIETLGSEKHELLELLGNEKEKSEVLQSELDLMKPKEEILEGSRVLTEKYEGRRVKESRSDDLQMMVMALKDKLESKENDCNELEDTVCEMRQELASRGEELTQVGLEYELQVNRLHEVLSKERSLNTLLSDESDETIKDLHLQLREKERLNVELKSIQKESRDKIAGIEEQCCFYQTKLKETEERLNVLCEEYEKSKEDKERRNPPHEVQQNETSLKSELRAYHRNRRVYELLQKLGEDKVDLEGVGNTVRHKLNIARLIQYGFKHLGRK